MLDSAEYKKSINQLSEKLVTIIAPLQKESYPEVDFPTLYWNVGSHIKKHIEKNLDKSHYKAYVFTNLPQKLQVRRQLLYYCYNFYKAFPSFDPESNSLSWGHYKALLSVKSPAERSTLERMASENKLQVTDLLTIIHKHDNSIFSLEKIHLPDLQTFPVIGKVKEGGGKTYLDLGFYTCTQLPAKEGCRFEQNTLVQINSVNQTYSFTPYTGDPVFLYIYKAALDRVVDGDTLSLIIDLGYHCSTFQRLRLKGIDAPALQSKRGLEAKKYIDKVLHRPNIHLAVKTKKRDRYSRFISDIYYSTKEEDPIQIINKGRYLNLELYKKGLADPYLEG